jgi:dihydroxyacetone kinase-like predicted kinase
LETAAAGQAELITLYYGADLTADQARAIAERIRGVYPEQEVELVDGGQPHYPLLLSVE